MAVHAFIPTLGRQRQEDQLGQHRESQAGLQVRHYLEKENEKESRVEKRGGRGKLLFQMLLWILLAMVMHIFSPSSQRQRSL